MAKRTPKAGAVSKTKHASSKPLPRDPEALRVLLRAVEQALRYLGPLHHRQASRLEAWRALIGAQSKKTSDRQRLAATATAIRKLAALGKGTDEQISRPVFPWRVIEPFVGARRLTELDRRIQGGKSGLAEASIRVSEGKSSNAVATVKRILPQPQDAVDALGSLVRLFEDFQSRLIERLSNRGADSESVSAKKKPPKLSTPIPEWDRDRAQLVFRGVAVRKFRSITIARNIVAILDAFQAQGWPVRIGYSFPKPGDKQRLREAVQNLNDGLKSLRFLTDGTGTGIRWKPIEQPRTGRAPAAHRH